MNLLDTVRIILLDMNSTFMFGEDRFSPAEDYSATYRKLGGNRLTPGEVSHAIQACYEGLSRDYESPEKYSAFPSLADGFRLYSGADDGDLEDLIDTFACHELGFIEDHYAQFLRALAKTHTLGLVANIWAPKDRWLQEFKRADIQNVFATTVFSSDLGCIKPAPAIYEKALEGTGVHPAEALLVGDSLKYDMDGAKNMGFNTVWINPDNGAHAVADYVIPTLLDLDELVSNSAFSKQPA